MGDGTARSAAEFIPAELSLESLRRAARSCTGCDLYRNATQTVFGEGRQGARAVFVGEQPGDQEDRVGRPFVGPAGRLLARAIREAGLAADEIYLTNAVKHFKWELRGGRRIHKRPLEGEIRACNPWLTSEITVLRPEIIVCLGTTAARAVFGRTVRVSAYRGKFSATPLSTATFVTVHPSALLRVPNEAQRQAEYERFVSDLRQVQARLAGVDGEK